jgi:hypothetical protein
MWETSFWGTNGRRFCRRASILNGFLEFVGERVWIMEVKKMIRREEGESPQIAVRGWSLGNRAKLGAVEEEKNKVIDGC